MFKDKAKNRVDDLQGMFSDLQSARRESRVSDVAVLEEQVNQMLREWKAELNEASPATSLLVRTPYRPLSFSWCVFSLCSVFDVSHQFDLGEQPGLIRPLIGNPSLAAAWRGGG